MQHNYTLKTTIKGWDVSISPKTNYGFFEFHRVDEKRDVEIHIEGGLWFQDKDLVDYDGVYALSRNVIDGIVDLGYTVNDPDFYPDNYNRNYETIN